MFKRRKQRVFRSPKFGAQPQKRHNRIYLSLSAHEGKQITINAFRLYVNEATAKEMHAKYKW